ncbi:MAG: FkbM family methyltransferase [Acidobacteria bacterium]|uniref:FkbM family methyltransferase n=1 Tax=Candidatus Polarisedimenticola svalbardensis TaxID=2886004 RepID=A0A8J7C3B9_9BACT|nr:FkbM family methyltransferase [Candidatus Polarisedimenticola svalbardensis]
MIKRFLNSIVVGLVNRRTRWRLGRAIYMSARMDVPNDMKTNGEERLLRDLLSSLSHNSDKVVLFDVGANIGEWTSAATEGISRAAMEDRAQIHAFEPVHSTFKALGTNISKLPAITDIQLVNVAMSDREGESEIFVFGETGGTNSLYPDELAPASNKETIRLNTLDRYCRDNQIEHVHFIKCDTEGNDFSVLCGAEGLLKEERFTAFQFEYNHRWIYSRHYLKDVFDLVKNTRYRIGKIIPERVELYPAWHPEMERFFEGNFLILHENALEQLSVKEGKFDSSNTFDTK